MTNSESLAVAEKLMVLLEEAAGLGMMASLNLETRNGMISTTFTCEELGVPDGKPSCNAEHRRIKAMEVQKEARRDYLNIRKANRRT